VVSITNGMRNAVHLIFRVTEWLHRVSSNILD
jgi:hypothetical protein